MELKMAALKGDLDFIRENIDKNKWFFRNKYADIILLNLALKNNQKEIMDYFIKRLTSTVIPIPRKAMTIENQNFVNQIFLQIVSLNKVADSARLTLRHKLNLLLGLMLNYSKDKYLVGDFGLSNLHIASATNQLEVISNIFGKNKIDLNTKVDRKSPYWAGYTPLHFAVKFSHMEVVKWLVEKGADIDVTNVEGSRPLHLAYKKSQSKISNIILRDTFINHVDSEGLSYFHVISAHGNVNLMKILLQNNKDLDINAQVHQGHVMFAGFTALHFAMMNNQFEAVGFLLSNDADFTIQATNGCKPLHLEYKQYESIIQFILDSQQNRHCSVNPKDSDS